MEESKVHAALNPRPQLPPKPIAELTDRDIDRMIREALADQARKSTSFDNIIAIVFKVVIASAIVSPAVGCLVAVVVFIFGVLTRAR